MTNSHIWHGAPPRRIVCVRFASLPRLVTSLLRLGAQPKLRAEVHVCHHPRRPYSLSPKPLTTGHTPCSATHTSPNSSTCGVRMPFGSAKCLTTTTRPGRCVIVVAVWPLITTRRHNFLNCAAGMVRHPLFGIVVGWLLPKLTLSFNNLMLPPAAHMCSGHRHRNRRGSGV